MRLSFFLLLLCSGSLLAQQALVHAQDTAPLYVHMFEINSYWLEQASPVGLLEAVQFSDEEARIQRHLQLVEQDLRQRTTAHLSAAQRAKRGLALDALHAYWRQKAFPVNRVQPYRLPIFVDETGNACAVGALLLATNQAALVRQIIQENNYAIICGTWLSAILAETQPARRRPPPLQYKYAPMGTSSLLKNCPNKEIWRSLRFLICKAA